MFAGTPAASDVTGVAQTVGLGDGESPTASPGPDGAGAEATQRPPFELPDGMTGDDPEGGGALDGVLAEVVVFDGVLTGGGADVVRTGLGGTSEPLRTKAELPLL